MTGTLAALTAAAEVAGVELAAGLRDEEERA